MLISFVKFQAKLIKFDEYKLAIILIFESRKVV